MKALSLNSLRCMTGIFLVMPVAVTTRTTLAQETVTEQNIITGTMDIDFKTRTTPDTKGEFVEGSPAFNVKDVYKLNMQVAKTTEFTGQITRQPNLYTRTLRQLKQGAALAYDITLSVLNPKDLKQKKAVGKWVGTVPVDTASGAFDLAAGTKVESPLRIAVDAVGTAQAFTDPFAGRMIGKAEKKDNLAGYTFKRLIGKKEVSITVTKSDPMKFDNVVLAKGPAEIYPRTTVTGRLDYDYETGNWFTDGLRFKYTLNGKEIEDVITGSIKWVEDPDRATNGKGQYEFNLRLNEAQNAAASTEASAFENMSAEDAFFAVDDSIPCLTGTVEYVDTMAYGSDLPSQSKVTYALHANKLTKQQVMNFFKLWLIGIGPINDE